jgi:hypothetical protein
MAKGRKRREKQAVETVDYTDDEGNVLTVRTSLSPGSVRKIRNADAKAATTAEDAWHRRTEMLFERLVVRWDIAGLPLEDQRMLIGRYRMATQAEQDWVRHTLAQHADRHLPELWV